MTNILVLATTFPRWQDDSEPGFVYQLHLRLARKGFHPTFLVPHAPMSQTQESMNGMAVLRFRYAWPEHLERVCYQGGAMENLRKSRLARVALPGLLLSQSFSIRRLIRSRKFELVHSHWIIPQGFSAAFWNRNDTPLLLTAHAGDVFPLRNRLLKKLAGFAVQRAKCCTANSRATARALAQVREPKRLEIIPMGVQVDDFANHKAEREFISRWPENKRIILGLGRLVARKGFVHLIRAMPMILKRHPAHLIIAGTGPAEGDLRRAIAELDLEENVQLVGEIPKSKVPDYLSLADVVVLPSVVMPSGDTEGLGVVLLESMAAKVPVVASKVGGIPDVIMHEQSGLLVQPESASALASATTRILSEKSLAEKLCERGFEQVCQRFSWDAVAEKFAALYREVLG